MKIYFVLTFLLFGVIGKAYADETLDQLREAYDAYREHRKNYEKHRPVGRESVETEVSVCASCPQVAGLTAEINKVMRKMVETNQIDSDEVGALEEVERLEAMYYIVHNDLEKAKRLKVDGPLEACVVYHLDVYLQNIESEPVEGDRLTEIFTFKMPLDHITALHYRNALEKGRYYFYRAAAPHEDKIIRIHIPENPILATVTYFQLDQIPHASRSGLMDQLKREKIDAAFNASDTIDKDDSEEDKVFGMDYWGGLSSFQGENSQLQAGLAIAHKKNIPRRILILQGKDETELAQDLKLNSEVEISDRNQEVRFRLNYQGSDLARLTGEADGDFRAEIPYAFSVTELDLSSTGSLAVTESGEEANLALNYSGSNLINVKGQNFNDGSQTLSVGNSQQMLGGTVSVDYQRKRGTDDDKETLWLRYQAQW